VREVLKHYTLKDRELQKVLAPKWGVHPNLNPQKGKRKRQYVSEAESGPVMRAGYGGPKSRRGTYAKNSSWGLGSRPCSDRAGERSNL